MTNIRKNCKFAYKQRKNFNSNFMKKPIMWVAALLTASCTPALKVEVANTTPTERDDETVEIAWSEVAALKGVTPDNIVVLNDDNEQIPSQVLFRGGTEPQAQIGRAHV